MQNILTRSIVALSILALAVTAFCPQVAPSQTPAQGNSAGNLAWDPRDLSGVWQMAAGGGGQGPGDNFPPLTAWGQARYDANKPGYGPRAAPGGNDPILKCDPMGFPRILFVIWPFEILHIPGRILMFFEGQHTIRPIWMDGRKLPDDPDPTWYGYSVGRWEGDTLVVETVGFNEKTWLGAQGQPHSDEMRTIERYRRIDRNTIDFNLTINDPKTYSKIWNTEPRQLKLKPGVEIPESFCVASEEEEFNRRIREPAARQPGKP
jgi:hypothetical protein